MAKRVKLTVEDFPEPGTVFIAPTGDGRLAAGRVLRREFHGGACGALIAACRWIGTEIPSLDSTVFREPLILTHHRYKGEAEIFWTHYVMPPEFTVIGQLELSDEDLAASSYSYTGWYSVPYQALTQWRWDHDREALLEEEAARATAEAEKRQKAAAVRAEFLRTLTLDSLAERKWFSSWEAASEALPLQESRTLISSLVEELRSHPKLTKGVVKRLLKRSVEAFNRLDAKGQFLSTIEREDLCEAYEQIVCAAGFPQVADEIDKWRDW